jgi:L-threonylcarbamoyladenylate synthase
MSKIGIDIEKAKQILQQGGLVAIPTETVYGLAANTLDETAVLKIFEAKNRPHFDPLIIHTNSTEKAKQYVSSFPDWAKQLANAFWPGALTLLLPKKDMVPDLVTSGLLQVAVRIPNHALTLQLLGSIDFPLAAPSANPFGYVSPTTAQHVAAQLQDKVDYILDGGTCEVGIESTIVGFEEGNITVYRLGGTAIEDIEKVVGKVDIKTNLSSNPQAPGMLKSHYAPLKPLFIDDINTFIKKNKTKQIGVISFNTTYPIEEKYLKILSPSSDLKEAAHHLFAAIRELDASDAEVIVAEKFPETFLGKAINDRLQRASVKE